MQLRSGRSFREKNLKSTSIFQAWISPEGEVFLRALFKLTHNMTMLILISFFLFSFLYYLFIILCYYLCQEVI